MTRRAWSRLGGSLRAAAVVALVALATSACFSSEDGIVAPVPPVDPGPAPVYAAIGASETAGIGAEVPLRDAWPRVLHRDYMPQETVFVNYGIPGATVTDALQETVAEAVEIRPDVTSVWLNVNDIIAGVTAADYQRDLETLLRRLRRGGATRVLVANTPPLDHLPAYLACRPDPPAGSGPCAVEGGLPGPEVVNALIAEYNRAIEAVAERTGSLVVDLHRVGVDAQDQGIGASLVSGDGFHPNSHGYAKVAAAFGEVLAASGPVTAAAAS